mmetsp:Transcript_81261/g.226242  ORF Transcript_81261/g.226242 Transcript_81261/m.226242 type:complete len:157 (-) Transcript_81261:1628-2098(-)
MHADCDEYHCDGSVLRFPCDEPQVKDLQQPQEEDASSSSLASLPTCNCRCTKSKYLEELNMSSSCMPSASFFPPSINTMRLALRTVDRRCATTNVVRLIMRASIAFCTKCSDAASNADVASSNKRMRGSTSRARAIATRCFCPPESRTPRSPTRVS